MESSSGRDLLAWRTSATLGLDLLQRLARGVRHEHEADHATYEEEDHEDQGHRPDAQAREHGHEEAPDAEEQSGDAEREPLRRRPEHGREQLLRPGLVERFTRDRGSDAEEGDQRDRRHGIEGEDEQLADRDNVQDGPDTPHRTAGAVAAVAEGHEDQDDDHQRDDEAGTRQGDAGRLALRPEGLEDVGREDAEGPRGQVPEQVHGRGKHHRCQGRPEKQVAQAARSQRVGRHASLLGLLLRGPRALRLARSRGGGPDGGLYHAPSEGPRDYRDHEQVGEDYPASEHAVRREHESQHVHDYRAQAPCHLAEAHEPAAGPAGRELPDQRERGRYIRAYRDANYEGSDEEHRQVGREDDQERAQAVDEQVVLIDALAAEKVAEPAPDQGPYRRPEGVRAQGREQSHGGAAHVQVLLPQREPRG